MFDDIIMNMIRNKVLECHVEGVDIYFTKTENSIIYMYRGSLQDFTARKASKKVLMLYVHI